MTNRLQGKVAVITGAASGIGAETARRMAAEGARVVLGDVNDAGLESVARETGGIAVHTDVTVEAEVRALIEAALTAHGRLDVLHNNAVMAIPEDSDAVATTDHAWHRTFDVVIMAAAYACRVAIPAMAERGGGSIINTSSLASRHASGRIAYASCKAALETFTLYTAGMFGPQGIRCNAVAPGTVRTEGMERIFTEEQFQQFASGVALGRMGIPRDIADVVVFLASDESSYVSGQVIAINGGGPPAQRW
ncbi:NAD(P)-dependent dehydrogenase, short-chain alcohol dehydrogenase family [Parafrankia irregularis]|uniref:NAD(P)-dependent dehydrogenase, short-chain alcohol dehydrogenase family n=1 Tax=Parafrankia irregularis TaxID=795642 RepID=A0A0S4QVF5_9ACTN|nr:MULTISPECIES: SDR family oxidoreductase [Parafrankia]MBE3199956.1 SDR family oxidoreductase [Parafrankia sp. CH37]CUU59300.1 NAD(P)-dependent dehydrogenase, short-chain alcohol dehydrogenase family [Parafrankia irregularis]